MACFDVLYLPAAACQTGHSHVYTHVYACVCTHVYTHVYAYVCTHVYTHVYAHVFTHVYTHVGHRRAAAARTEMSHALGCTHNYLGHNCLGHNCLGHNYLGHDC